MIIYLHIEFSSVLFCCVKAVIITIICCKIGTWVCQSTLLYLMLAVQYVFLSGQLLGTRWDLTLPPPSATPTLTWMSSYDNDGCLCAPPLRPHHHFPKELLPSLHFPVHTPIASILNFESVILTCVISCTRD